MNKVLKDDTSFVYVNDGHGGVSKLELDWERDVIWEHEELNDAYDSIEEHFINRSYKWYESVIDCVHEMNEFTHIKLR